MFDRVKQNFELLRRRCPIGRIWFPMRWVDLWQSLHSMADSTRAKWLRFAKLSVFIKTFFSGSFHSIYVKLFYTYISTYIWQFSRVNASNLPSEHLFYRIERVTALCRRQGHVKNRFGHFDLNGHVFDCFAKTSSWSYCHFETAIWTISELNAVSHINRNLNGTFTTKKKSLSFFYSRKEKKAWFTWLIQLCRKRDGNCHQVEQTREHAQFPIVWIECMDENWHNPRDAGSQMTKSNLAFRLVLCSSQSNKKKHKTLFIFLILKWKNSRLTYPWTSHMIVEPFLSMMASISSMQSK